MIWLLNAKKAAECANIETFMLGKFSGEELIPSGDQDKGGS